MYWINRQRRRGWIAAACVFSFLVSSVTADTDGLLVQSIDGKLVTGDVSDDLTAAELGVRTFSAQFPSTFAWNNPGFHSLGTPPSGVDALPPSMNLDWDFVPMHTNGMTSNLLYWDGQGTTPADVEFGLPPSGYTLTLFGRNNEAAAADGSDALIPGRTIDRTNDGPGLRMHAHRFFFLDDNDGSMATLPDDGIYLMAMQVRMQGFETSDPFYLVWGTLAIPPAVIETAAVPWVRQREDVLVGLGGDFNEDGLWDCGDVDLLTQAIATSSTDMVFDLNGDGLISAADITEENVGWLAVAGRQSAVTGGGSFLVGDANLDGTVDVSDFNLWNNNKFTANDHWCQGDFNADGLVDVSDFNAWNTNKFLVSAPQSVPEPNSLCVWLGLILVLRPGGIHRRQQFYRILGVRERHPDR